ncbi:MAG: argininosuccinate lyase [Flavobacteriaceae bacterium]|nr:argininosuccinate lyase [Flavobacteriaceae bacterium]
MKLWEKGLAVNDKIERFTVGDDRETDMHLAWYDVQASVAHAQMLEKVGLIDNDELKALLRGLNLLKETIEKGTFRIESEFEDVHSKIEYELIKSLGDNGKKIHTARSRNDQVLVAMHLYFKDKLETIHTKVKTLFDTLIELGENHRDHFLPGYTHFQRAMPSSFGLWFSAYAEILIDDVYQLQAAYKIVDQNPLGSAAGYGSSFPIDRDETTKALGFSNLKINSIAAQLSRGRSERAVAGCMSGLASTLNKFATDICTFVNQEFNFISFPDSLTTGSSIMPHKKNPDVFELIRAKANSIKAIQHQLMMLTTNLTSGYHRDFQLLKKPIIDAVEDTIDMLDIFSFAIKQIEVKQLDPKSPEFAHLFSVDSINKLVQNGMPFRDAYLEIAQAIQDNTYQPDPDLKHTHIGSIHNLGLDRIKAKFPPILDK